MRFLILLLLFPGCAIFGKTNYSMEFKDVIDGQDTRFKVKVKAPAGDIVEAIGNMEYKWNEDSSGHISVNQSTNIDSTAQAQMLLQLQMINAQILQNLTPLAPSILQNRTENKKIEAETEKVKAQISADQFNAYMERWSEE